MKYHFPTIVAILIAAGSIAEAAVDLVTIPRREGTQLTIYNSEDITMVREHRLLTVKKGVNRIQFSWANTLIDPTSIDFRILDSVDKVQLLDTTFPAGRNDALQWNIRSDMDGKIPVEIRYFTSGITWQANYVGVANEDETKMDLTGYVRVMNNSGELYDNAQTRLVVGKINLVEKIADLAQRPAPTGESGARRAVLLDSMEKAMDMPQPCEEPMAAMPGPPATTAPEPPKEVKKQGLSEYFLFTIAGREDIKDAEPKQLVSMKIADVPLECVYKLSDRVNANQFDKYYRFTNEKLVDETTGEELKLPDMENLGLSPMPDGTVRLYFKYRNDDLAYVGGTSTKYVPIGDRLEVNVGADPDITIVRRLKDRKITGVVARQYKRHTSHSYAEYYDLIDYDETFTFEEEIISGKASLAKVEVERRFNADVTLWGSDGKPDDWDSDEMGAYVDLSNLDGRVERVDQNHVKYFVDMQPGEKRVVTYTVTHKQRKIGPKLNGYDRSESVTILPKDQEDTGPTPRNPIPPPSF